VLDLNDVALFVQIVRSGSFAAAARRLGVPANTLSRRVQRLESGLSTRLLQRSTRKLALTGPGQDFFDRCAGAVDGLGDAGQELMSGNREPVGLVRVAAAADFFDFFQMEWLAEFLATFPKVRIEFVLSDARADLIADRIDLAIRGGGLEDSGFIARQVIAPGRGGLVASPDYLAARGTPQTLADLAQHDCVLLPHPGGRRSWQLTGPDGIEEAVEVTGRFTANTAQALRKATLAGLGIALLPPAVTRRDLREGQLVQVLPSYHRASNGLNVLYPSRHHLPLATAAFRDLIVAKLGVLDELPPQA
jgi:DNA-binding transcriptional LysR family regulator